MNIEYWILINIKYQIYHQITLIMPIYENFIDIQKYILIVYKEKK